jgi:hypothetical protein
MRAMGGVARSLWAGKGMRALAVSVTLIGAIALLGHLPGDLGGMDSAAASQTGPSPDLVVFDLRLSGKELIKGEDLVVNTLISNRGNATAQNVSVTFLHGSKRFAEMVVPTLAPGTNREVEARWHTDTASVREHDVRVVIDLGNAIHESNETNNEASAEVNIKENPLITYSIPILLLIAVLGLLGYRAYTWAVIRSLRKRQHGKGGCSAAVHDTGGEVSGDRGKG